MRTIIAILAIFIIIPLNSVVLVVGAGQHNNIQSAIDAALLTTGEATIRVQSGTYTKSLVINFENSSLSSMKIEKYASTNTCIINEDDTDIWRTIEILGTFDKLVTIDGFDIRNQDHRALVSSGVNLKLINCNFSNAFRVGEIDGSNDNSQRAYFEITNCNFEVNENLGQGQDFFKVLNFNTSNRFNNNVIMVNSSNNQTVRIIYVSNCDNIVFMNNMCTGNGQRKMVQLYDSDVEFIGNSFSSSEDSIIIDHCNNTTIEENIFSDTRILFASNDIDYVFTNDRIVVENNDFLNSNIWLEGANILMRNNNVNNDTFDNKSFCVYGNAEIRNNDFVRVRVSTIDVNDGSLEYPTVNIIFENNLISSALIEGSLHHAIFIGNNSNLFIKNNTIVSTTIDNGHVIFVDYNIDDSAISCFKNNIINGFESMFSGQYTSVAFCDINYCCTDVTIPNEFLPPAGSDYNVYGDPLFVNPTAGNFHLQPTSPCIDAGDPDDNENGKPYEPVDLDPYGSRKEMGCYPYTEAQDTKWYNDNRYNWISLPRMDHTNNHDYAQYVFGTGQITNPDPTYMHVDDPSQSSQYDPIFQNNAWTHGTTVLGNENCYKVKMDGEVTYYKQNLTGTCLAENTPITLYAGQDNWIGYWCLESADIDEAFGNNWQYVTLINAETWTYSPMVNPHKDGIGSSTPAPSNKIRPLHYGKGYNVKVRQSITSCGISLPE